MADTARLTVPDELAGARLDSAMAALSGLSRSACAALIERGAVQLDGRAAAKRDAVAPGMCITYTRPDPRPVETRAENIPLTVVYEDDDLLVINKPVGMVVHPAAGNEEGTLVNALLYHCAGHLSGINGELRPGIVHRLDKDTSGLLVVAKNDEAHRALSAQLSDHTMYRVYHALVNGGFREPEGTVDRPVGRHPTERKKMAVLPPDHAGARRAVTHFRVLEDFGPISYLSLRLETGRTHQIRVHMASLGHPLLGDTLYGGGHSPFERQHAAYLHGQCLHAKELSFLHPRTGERVFFSCDLPSDFLHLLAVLRAGV